MRHGRPIWPPVVFGGSRTTAKLRDRQRRDKVGPADSRKVGKGATTVTTDDLSTPLGQETPPPKRRRLPVSGLQVAAILLAGFLLTFAGFALFHRDPLGGEPVVSLTLETTPPAARTPPATEPARPPEAAAKNADTPAMPAPGQRTITIIDGSSGARQNVVIPGDDVGGAAGNAGDPATPGINPRLLEKSRHGMIPVAADGLMPFTAYATATPAEQAKAATMPTIAIVVTGLGIGAARTLDAVIALPPAVTLAFIPYGADLARQAARARAARHEILLQVPMEPVDYPDNDPGPQTLLTTLSAEQNLDRLFWHLSRFQGFVGITNFMGARFTASETAMQPLIREAAKRGLGYLDSGTMPRSTAGQLALGQAMPFAQADAGIDAVPTATEIDRALARLEDIAKSRGSAIGIASSLPVTIDRINAWSKGLENRGLLLVPLTTAMLKSKSS